MKKASIQVSVNFLVVIIIGIVMLSFGGVLLKNMISSSGDQLLEMDERLQGEIEKVLLRDGKPIAIPIIQKTISRGDVDVFGIGVLNVDGFDYDFVVKADFSSAYRTSDGSAITVTPSFDPGSWITEPNEIRIKNSENFVFPVPVSVPKAGVPKGEYIYNLYICRKDEISGICDGDSDELYDGNVYKVYVKIS